MSETRRLQFGYNRGLPENVSAAWGCRAIVTPDNDVDIVPDRKGDYGPDDAYNALVAHLDAGATNQWRARASELLKSGEMSISQDREHVLLDDGVVVVKANTNASYGYLYVCAYLPGDDDEDIAVGDFIRRPSAPEMDIQVLEVNICDCEGEPGNHSGYLIDDPESGRTDWVCSRDFVKVTDDGDV